MKILIDNVPFDYSNGCSVLKMKNNECHLILDERGMDIYGSSAYFVPEERVLEMGLDGEN
jgi:hypothetical protein